MRDHLLGFPPALLALDTEPPKPDGRTQPRARLTPEEQAERVKLDVTPLIKVEWEPKMGLGMDYGGRDRIERTLRDFARLIRFTDCAGQAPAMATSGDDLAAATPDPALSIYRACEDVCEAFARVSAAPALPTGIPEWAMWVDRDGDYWRRDEQTWNMKCLLRAGWAWITTTLDFRAAVNVHRLTPIPGARIPHDGGPCPVPPETRIAALWFGERGIDYGRCAMENSTADAWHWDRGIVAYEVVA